MSAGEFRGKAELPLARGQAPRPRPALADDPCSPCSVPALLLRSWLWRGPGGARRFFHREEKPHGGKGPVLQDTGVLWCHCGPLWGLGLVAAQGGHLWVGWGQGRGVQGMVTPRLAPSFLGLAPTFSGEGLFFGRGVGGGGVSSLGRGQQPLSLYHAAVLLGEGTQTRHRLVEMEGPRAVALGMGHL